MSSSNSGGGSSSSPSLEAVLSSVRSAVVYADAGAADWINWRRLLPELIQRGGALAVREFHPSERLHPAGGGGGSGSAAIKKAVFLLAGRPDAPVAMETLAELVTGTGLNYVIVLTGACPEFSACANIEERIGDLLGHGATAQVRFVPLGHLPLVPGELMTASAQPDASSGAPPPPEFVVLGGQPDSPEALVRSLHSLLAELSLKEDLFCLGQASCRLGDALAAFGPAKERRKQANHKRAALLLVDRTLDVIGPLSFLNDAWLDALYRTGKPLLLSDVQVDLTAFTRSRCPEYLPVGSLSGCLDCPLGRRLASDAGKSKAAAAAAQRAVADAMTAERVAFDPSLLLASASSSSSSGALGRLLDRLAAARPDLAFAGRHAAAIQLAAAVSQSATEQQQQQQQRDSKQSLVEQTRLEKSLIGATAGTPDELAAQLTALDAGDVGAGLPPDDLLALKLIGASLTSAAVAADGHQQRISNDSTTTADGRLLARLAAARAAQPRLRLCDCSVVPTYSPLIGQLAGDIVPAAAPAAGKSSSGLQYAHKSTGLAGLFGYLGVTSKPKPADFDLVLVCVIGGCCWSEHRVLRERLKQLASGSGKRVVLVTDRLLRGRDQLLGALRRGDLLF